MPASLSLKIDEFGGCFRALMKMPGCGISLRSRQGSLRTVIVRDYATQQEADSAFGDAAKNLGQLHYHNVQLEKRSYRVVVVLDESLATQNTRGAFLDTARDFYEELGRAA